MSSIEIAERVVARFAQLSPGQKEDAVKKVMTNLKAKSKSKKKPKPKKKSKSKKKPKKEKAPEKDEKAEESRPDEKVDEVKPEETEESTEAPDGESGMSDDGGLMQSIQDLSEELERVKQDGRVDSSEVLGLFNNLMDMVNTLLRAKPGRKVKAADRVACAFIARVAARGLQVRRKDKDLMRDTGGTSKGREREPEQKPPREENKKPHRTKDKPAKDRDKDTDNDKDLKASGVHPLDRKAEFIHGVEGPEDNYYRRVWSALVNVITSAEGISEKSFDAYDEVMRDVDGMLRTPEAMEVVGRFEGDGLRPQFCAEHLFSRCERV